MTLILKRSTGACELENLYSRASSETVADWRFLFLVFAFGSENTSTLCTANMPSKLFLVCNSTIRGLCDLRVGFGTPAVTRLKIRSNPL